MYRTINGVHLRFSEILLLLIIIDLNNLNMADFLTNILLFKIRKNFNLSLNGIRVLHIEIISSYNNFFKDFFPQVNKHMCTMHPQKIKLKMTLFLYSKNATFLLLDNCINEHSYVNVFCNMKKINNGITLNKQFIHLNIWIYVYIISNIFEQLEDISISIILRVYISIIVDLSKCKLEVQKYQLPMCTK